MTAATSRGWLERAGCRGVDPELFFPYPETSNEADNATRRETDVEPGRGRYSEQVAAAKAVCAGCPVRAECLRFALGALTDGIAGGLDEHERRALRRSRPATGTGGTAGHDVASGEAASSEPAAVAREGRAAGRSLGSLAAELGVSTRTVERWTRTGAA